MDDLLSAMRQLIPISSDGQALVESLFEPHPLAAHAFFLRAGEVCQYAGFVSQGLLRYYLLDNGVEHTYDFSPEQTFVCHYESFLTQAPSNRSIQALEPTTLWRISYANLQRLYQQLDHGQQFGRLIAEQLFVHSLQKLTAFYWETAEERYDRFLREYPHLMGRLPQYVIASYVGIKPQSLSRIRAQKSGKL